MSTHPPGPRGLPIVGSLFEMFWDEGIDTMMRWMREHGELARAQAGPWTMWLVNDPDALRRVLQDNAGNYKRSRTHRELEITLGKGLLTSEGELWAHQRRHVVPSLQAKFHPRFFTQLVASTEEMLATWGEGVRDLLEEALRVTFAVAGRAFVSTDLTREAPKVGAAMEVLRRHFETRSQSPLNLPASFPTPGNRRAQRAVAAIDETVYGLIRARRDAPDLGDDVMGVLLRALDEGAFPEKQLRDELVTLLIAGHETTANGLTWTFYLLSQHPEVERRVVEEVEAILGGRSPTWEDVPKLTTVARVVDESLRLLPPIWYMDREAAGPDTLGGYAVAPGDTVIICPYTLHRNPRWWPDPERFDPDRFLPERVAERPRFTYLPFGAGPRSCVGASFARMELQVIVAMVMQRYRLRLVEGHSVGLESLIALRPRGGMPVVVTPRA